MWKEIEPNPFGKANKSFIYTMNGYILIVIKEYDDYLKGSVLGGNLDVFEILDTDLDSLKFSCLLKARELGYDLKLFN